MQHAEMPAGRRLLHRRERTQREELAAQRAGVLAPEGLLVRSGLQIEAADGSAQAGDLVAERHEIDADLVVPGSRRGEEDGVVLGFGELERVIGVDEDGAGDRPPLEQRAGLTIGAIEPAPVAVAVGRLALIERPLRSARGTRKTAAEDDQQRPVGHAPTTRTRGAADKFPAWSCAVRRPGAPPLGFRRGG